MCCAQIGGTLPAAFGKRGSLPRLQLLNVWGNQLSGTLPADWWLPRLSHAAPRACHTLHSLPGGRTLLPAYLQTCACSEASMLHTVCNARHAAVAFNCDAHSLHLDKQAHAWHLDKTRQEVHGRQPRCAGSGRGADGSLAALSSILVSQNHLRGPVPPEWGQPGRFAPLAELLLMSSGGGACNAHCAYVFWGKCKSQASWGALLR